MLPVRKGRSYSDRQGQETYRIPREKPQGTVMTNMAVDRIYHPFLGKCHIYGPKKEKIAVTILGNTRASQSILLQEKLPRGARKVAREKNNRQRNRREENRSSLM